MRHPSKLAVLVLAVALAVGLSIAGGLHGISTVQAQAVGPENCSNPTGGTPPGTLSLGAVFTCTFSLPGGTGSSLSIGTAAFAVTAFTSTACPAGSFALAPGGNPATFTCPTASALLSPTLISFTATIIGPLSVFPPGAGFLNTIECNGPTLGCGGSNTPENLLGYFGGCSVALFLDGTCFGVTHQPTGEVKYCNNTSTLQGLNQVIGGNTLDAGVSGPGTSFTIPLFGGASTCWIQLTQNGLSCNNTTVICSDGYVTVSLTTPGSSAVLACGSTASPLAQPFIAGLVAGPPPLVISSNGGTCQSLTGGTSILLPCGVTAGTPTGSINTSWTCTSVVFDIASFLSGCATGQTSVASCPLGSNAYALQGGTATVTVSYQNTAINGGVGGGIVLGTNSFSFQSPGVGTLLVTATPQLIPSNGTMASVITATFACGSGFSLTPNGFPLSAGGIVGTGPNFTSPQGILGFGNVATCGAGLPGSFTFATPGEVLFDNGRTSESVGCGLNGQQNLFGGSSLFNPNNLNPTLPLVFTCTGAAVLAIGGGAAGDAPINVTYTSAVGGLTAVGSTLITVAPSGVPRISVACNPSTIAAGNTGSLCTATVTDQNGTPLTGSEGATVTWTVSDTTVAQILPCVVNLGAANGILGTGINITTSPNFIPQIVPNAPCNPASGSIPGQSVTFLNGQTTALLVASSYAHPEVVTVAAVLGVLIPPEYACEVSPYTPVGYGAAQFLGSAAPSGFGPGLTGCGAGNPVGLTGLASALSTAGNVALNGIVTLPNATSASTTVSIGGPAGILVVGATTSQPLGLLHGCNNIIVTTTAGTPIANIAALVSPAGVSGAAPPSRGLGTAVANTSSALVSIWAFNNSTKQFRAGFFSDPAAPVDYNVTGGTAATQQGSTAAAGSNGLATTSANVATGTQVTESYFICVNQAAEIISG